MNKANFLRGQLDKAPEESKKWRMTIIGLKGLGVAFFTGIVMIAFRPAQAGHFATLVQIAMTAWGGIVGIYLGAQGSVEYKATAALQTTQETREEHVYQHVAIEEGRPGSPAERPWKPLAVNEF